MSTTKQLKNAAEELIDVLGLVDDDTKKPIAITKKTTDAEMIDIIKEAAEAVEPDDEISDETRTVIDELLNADKKAAPAAKGKAPAPIAPSTKGKKVPEPEPKEEEDPEDVPEEDTGEALFAEVEDAETLKELKAILANNDEFKSVAKKLNVIKDVDDLREAMLEILTPEETPEDPEEKIVVKVDTKAKKAAPAPEPTPAKKKAVAPVKEVPAAKEKAVKAAKESKEKKALKEKSEKKDNAAYLTRKFTCENPKIKTSEIIQKLEKMGIKSSPISVNIRRNEMLAAISIMSELNKLK
jgi:hypothetical protein